MIKSELISAIVFITFWLLVYYYELRYFLFQGNKKAGCLKSRGVICIHMLAVIGIVWLFYAYFIEPNWIDVCHVNIKSDKFKKTVLTVVQISDFHCDRKIRNETKMVKLINEISPDVIVFTGDALNTAQALPLFKQTLTALEAGIGKFAVRGNWDSWFWNNLDLFSGTGFIELDGKSVSLNKDNVVFTISGLSVDNDFTNLSFLKQLASCDYNILLFHYPGVNEEIRGVPFDLFLSGHTHGGQIALPFYGALITLSKYGKKYEAGEYDVGGGKILYVNRGLGMEGGLFPRLRFRARPEITVFHIGAV